MPLIPPFPIVADAVAARFPDHSWRSFCAWAKPRGGPSPSTVTRARGGERPWREEWTVLLGDYLDAHHPGRHVDVVECILGQALARWGCRPVDDDVVAGSAVEELHRVTLDATDLVHEAIAARSPASPGGATVVAEETAELVNRARELRRSLDSYITASEDSGLQAVQRRTA